MNSQKAVKSAVVEHQFFDRSQLQLVPRIFFNFKIETPIHPRLFRRIQQLLFATA
jgi:hypothetical protein